MADVIHPDQTYTVPGSSIFDNLFLVRDLLELGRRDGLSFALLSLDQEKAFDRVDHGRLTGLVLREPELRLVLSAYADDVLLMVQDLGDLAWVEACQAIYSAASSTRLNWVKSSGLAVGDWQRKGDLRDLRNWRPISLLSTDYKIVAKAISLQLGSVLVDVIHPDETYTIPDRSIFDNLFMVQDLLELGCRDGLSLDQEKAFDRMDHGYLLSTLQAFGFGPQFVGFLQVLYTSAECMAKLNWTLTEPVSFGRGVQQGCPLSGQLYALVIEPFLCLLRRRLTGLVMREPELRLVLSAYADDVLLVVQDPGDLARVEACQAIYFAASSARVNLVKSSGLAIRPILMLAECSGMNRDGLELPLTLADFSEALRRMPTDKSPGTDGLTVQF
ncbi:unnamed protein product [Caretta caretta]